MLLFGGAAIPSTDHNLRHVRRKAARSAPAVIVLICGVLFSALGFQFIENRVGMEERTNFRLIADRYVLAIEQLLLRNIETVHSLGGLFDASEIVSHEEFVIFARQMLSRVGGVQALSWNPRISAERLADIRRLARREGMTDYDFHERGTAGARQPLQRRNDYIPVLYIEPKAGNRAALGYDIGSDSIRRAALDRARDTGGAVATAPIKLVQEPGTQSGFLVLRPVYINGARPDTLERRRRSIKGYAVGVYRVGDMLASVLKTVGTAPIHIALFDETDAGSSSIPVFTSAKHGVEDQQYRVWHEGKFSSLEISKKIILAGRTWVLRVHPSAPLITSVERYSSWVFAIAGTVLSLLAYVFLVSIRSRSMVIELEVEHRTRELAEEVSVRKAAESALRRSERTYAKLTEMAPVGIFIYRDQKVKNANVAAANLLGASSVEALLGRNRREFIDPKFHVEAEKRWAAIQEGKSVPVWEVETRRLDGTTFPAVIRTETVDIDGDRYVITVVEDVSDETRSRQALLDSEEKYRSLIEFFPEGVLLSENGIITQINPAGVRLYGAEQESEIIGRDWITLVDPSFHELILERRDLMQTGRHVEPIEILMFRLDGSTFWAVSQAMPVKVSGTTFYMTVFDDITGRKAAEQEIENANRELVRSNEELAQFAYVASHDLKEPLRMVSSYCGLIGERYADKLDETGQKFVYYAADGALRMQTLIDDLLVFSKIGRGGEEAVSIDLREVVDDVSRVLAEAIREADASLTVGDLPTVLGYRTELIRLFQNLIGNAVKFRDKAPLSIEVTSERAGKAWTITVSDNGIGIPPEFRERVFGIFQRLHNREEYEGTGIGLAICEKIVGQMGGRIWLEDSPEGGSALHFTIPDIRG